jgi:hypothetical protein
VTLFGLFALATRTLTRPPRNPTDVGMYAFALMSIAVPTVSSLVAGTDLSARLLSPVLITIIYFAAVTIERSTATRTVVAIAGGAAALSILAGVVAAFETPDRLSGSSDNDQQFAPDLYDRVAALPEDANILTNNPQRVWWHSDRFPVRLGFTEPKPGNSHFPLSPDDTLQLACDGNAYLAWFSTMRNAQGSSPGELRPDVARLVTLTVIDDVDGGTLFALGVVDPATCT